ncbi:MAG: thioredoxin [Calditrichota bacterium]
MSGMIKVQDDQFEAEVKNSVGLTLVDFGAEWCGPCKKLHPVMDELAREFEGKLKVVEVDVGESPQVATEYRITSVPRLLFFQEGVVRETVVGLLPKSKIVQKIERFLETEADVVSVQV